VPHVELTISENATRFDSWGESHKLQTRVPKLPTHPNGLNHIHGSTRACLFCPNRLNVYICSVQPTSEFLTNPAGDINCLEVFFVHPNRRCKEINRIINAYLREQILN